MEIEINDTEFIITVKDSSSMIKWSEVKSLITYKKDFLTFDVICLDIVCDSLTFTITEELPCWLPFVDHAQKIFNSIPETWYLDVMQPPFATNSAVIYDRD